MKPENIVELPLRQKAVDAVFGLVPPAPAVQPFDFLAPPRLARERRARLDAVLQRLAPAVSSLLSARLRRAVDVLPGECETATAAEFLASLPAPCAAVAFGTAPSVAVAELGVAFGLYVVERLFGGAGEGQWLERPLTALEQNAIAGLVEKLPALFAEAVRLPGFAGRAGAIESEATSLSLGEPEAAVVVMRLELRASGLETTWSLGVPLAALEPLFESPDEAPASPAAVLPENLRELQQAHVQLLARLPLFRMKARDLAALTEGQTVPTGHRTETVAEVLVNGRVRFRAAVGQMQGQRGLRITEVVATPLPARPARDREGRAL